MIEIGTGDFRKLSNELADGSIDLVLTDPPYPKEFLPLWADLARVSARVLKPGGFLVAYSGQLYLRDVMTMLDEHLTYYWLGGLRHNGPKGMVWARKVLNAMKPILVYAKEPIRKQPQTFIDLVDSQIQSKRFHKWGQSVSPVMCLLDAFTVEGDLVLDPFLGGGTTAVACLQTGRDCIGYEIDPAMADEARGRLADAQLPLFVPVPQQCQLELA